MSDKRLSVKEAKDVVRYCVRTGVSEGGIRSMLNEFGFHGDDATIVTTGGKLGPAGKEVFMARVLVKGPGGEVVSV